VADLNSLDYRLVPWAKWIHRIGTNYDGRLVVTSARRSRAKQAELRSNWERGISKIPANRPGTSLHEHGLAFDLARIGMDPLTDPLLAALGALWERVGGRWGGIRDPVHFQPIM